MVGEGKVLGQGKVRRFFTFKSWFIEAFDSGRKTSV